ncbi:MAG: hypothetical protein ACOZBZ_02025 [Patescibacteria group bacterium]
MWLLFIILSLLLGYLTISFWRQEFSKIEKIFISFSLGMGEMSLLMFLLGLLKAPLSVANIILASGIICLVLLVCSFLKTGSPFKIRWVKLEKLSILEAVLVLILGFLVIWSLSQSIGWPPFEWDVLALYDFRARVMAETHSLATEFFTSQPNLTAYNYVYPFSTSLMHTLIYIGGGSNPQFLYSLFYASLVFLLYACLRRRLPRLFSLLLGATLASTPEILFPSTIAYPNIPYAFYFSFSTIYFWEWIFYQKTGFLVVSALFLGLASWIRNTEPFWIVNIFFILIFLLYKRKLLLTLFYAVVFLTLSQLWPVYQKYIFSHVSSIVFSPPQTFSFDLTKVPPVTIFVLRFFIKDWIGYLFILFMLVILSWRKAIKNLFILFWLGGYLFLSLVGTYFFAVSFPWWYKVGGSASRLSVFLAPLILYTIAMLLAEPRGFSSSLKKIFIFLKIGRQKIRLLKWPQK